MAHSLALSVKNLSFTYPNAIEKQLDGITFEIQQGARYGIFGPNGAGKTTLIHVILGVLSGAIGEVLFENTTFQNKKSLYKHVGIVPQEYSFYEELTLKENLDFYGSWYGLSKQDIEQQAIQLTQTFGLYTHLNTKIKYFSGGMKRRVNLAIGVMHQPKILFLDEPTVGVDIQSRHSIIEYLKHININNGVTLVYTSHHLKEAQLLCTNFMFLDNGKLIQSLSLEELNKDESNDLESLFLKLTGTQYRDE